MTRLNLLSICLCWTVSAPAFAGGAPPRVGPWRAWLDCPGGELPFELDLASEGRKWHGWIINGPERIDVPEVTWDGNELLLNISHYDSAIRAKTGDDGSTLEGEWKKRSGAEEWSTLAFHARAGAAPQFPIDPQAAKGAAGKSVAGRWAVKFARDEEPAVGVFEVKPDGMTTGTFLTTTGDYGYLAGSFAGDRLRLSSFDGGHAFLFDARLGADDSLTGDFWARDAWHDTWTAKREPGAALPDAFGVTHWTEGATLSGMVFQDLDGNPRSLADASYAGKARIIEIFGTWCPNCHDASRYFVELHRRYHKRGLSVVGVAFELTGDFKRDAEQVRRFAKRHEVEYPLLLGGERDREKASAALPLIDELRAYPTTIVLDATGRVRAVHTGFSGPATGEAYDAFRVRFEKLIEELLAANE